jgi:hypothetical protein
MMTKRLQIMCLTLTGVLLTGGVWGSMNGDGSAVAAKAAAIAGAERLTNDIQVKGS